MIRGGALYLTVFIAFILAVLCTLLITTGYYNNLFYNKSIEEIRLYDNALSGLNLLLTQEAFDYNKPEEVELFDEVNDLVALKKEHWGVYEIHSSTAYWRNQSVSLMALTGDKSLVNERTGLYLADHGKYLSVGGKTRLSGNTYLPKIGIRRAYIDGEVYSGSQLIYGSEKRSAENLPVPDAALLKRIKSYLLGNNGTNDSLVNSNYLWKDEKIYHSFYRNTAYIELGSTTYLDQMHCQGKLILFSRNKIIISGDNIIEDAIIIAPEIKVNSGFSGSVQLFARDTVEIEQGCSFNYPSCIGMVGSELAKPYLEIGVGTTVAGVVFVYSENNELAKPRLVIDENATITGFTYCNGTVELKGNVLGSLYCDEFELQTERAFYVNHLLNASVDPMAVPDFFISRNIFDNSYEKEVIKWMD